MLGLALLAIQANFNPAVELAWIRQLGASRLFVVETWKALPSFFFTFSALLLIHGAIRWRGRVFARKLPPGERLLVYTLSGRPPLMFWEPRLQGTTSYLDYHWLLSNWSWTFGRIFLTSRRVGFLGYGPLHAGDFGRWRFSRASFVLDLKEVTAIAGGLLAIEIFRGEERIVVSAWPFSGFKIARKFNELAERRPDSETRSRPRKDR